MPNVKKKNERIEIQGRVDVSLCNSKSCQPKRMYAFFDKHNNNNNIYTEAKKKNNEENDSVNSRMK